MSTSIRMETTATARLGQVQDWFSAHRGQTIGLARERRIELGAPIWGAGAVLVAVTVQTAEAAAPELGGVVRALASRRSDEPALLVFEGRSPAHLPDEDARLAASELLDVISSLAAGRDLMAEVA
jgi:hypothetical protein